MSTVLPDAARDLADGPNYAVLTMLNADGSPQSSQVWVGRDGDELLIGTIAGRHKGRNVRRDPRTTVCIVDSQLRYRYAEVRGRAEVTADGAAELVRKLAVKYPEDAYEIDDSVPWLVIRITPDKVNVVE
ncbi:PPOX class F420-dependent enzyme [Longimycelium tulufanense]|uniref:PPOX class F420-dependent enzyme n=1 Tax=Longimycelium tulufanense TaxID=907463 RepID=A0A8J3CAI4_9PSEU|nr:PPOX class F420-dependent oxidoreductase [Longimycelium tulufanense]GGM44514.1 PPOX class F420-dependent enzyme [Longimycelium tulufanense]